MAEYCTYCSGAKEYNSGNGSQEAREYTNGTAEFGPIRPAALASPSATTGREAYCKHLPPVFPAESIPIDRSSPVTELSPTRLWIPSAVTAATTSSTAIGYGFYPCGHQDNLSPTSGDSVSCASAATMATVLSPTQIDRLPAAANLPSTTRNNPYLTPDIRPVRAVSASCRQQQQHRLQDCGNCAHEAAVNGLESRAAHRLQRSSFRSPAGVNDDQGITQSALISDRIKWHEGAFASAPSALTHELQQLPVFHGPRASPVRSDNTMMHVNDTGIGVFNEDADIHFWGTDERRVSAGKSQSMRALYEENAALRRALHSLRRGSRHVMDSNPSTPLTDQIQLLSVHRDRCVANDVAEGRAVSMRERGRWARQAVADGSFPVWVGTPRRLWAAGPPALHAMQATAGQAESSATSTQQHPRPAAVRCNDHYHIHQNQSWWPDQEEYVTGDQHPVFYSGGSFGGWPETVPSYMWCGDDYDTQNEWAADPYSGAAPSEGRNPEIGTSLRQLLSRSGGGGKCSTGMVTTTTASQSKWCRPEGKWKKAASSARRTSSTTTTSCGDEVATCGYAGEKPEFGVAAQQCAMCGRHVDAGGGKRSALPLCLCPACHPHAAASLPHSTTSPSQPSHRHRVATAVFLACRPTAAAANNTAALFTTTSATTTSNTSSSSTTTTSTSMPKQPQLTIKNRSSGGSSNRILHLCRQFMGLPTSKPPPSSSSSSFQ